MKNAAEQLWSAYLFALKVLVSITFAPVLAISKKLVTCGIRRGKKMERTSPASMKDT
jgi:hypothetical protein